MSRFSIAVAVTGVALISGCGQSDAPVFRLNMPQMVNSQIDVPYQRQIADVLAGMFGTPDEPFVLPETGLNLKRLQLAAGPVRTDAQGAGQGLYRRHCAHCHGINGDGRGPTAMFLNPYPRDYRPAVYKFKSTYNPARPTDEDLRRVLLNGVPGTAMPAFALLPPGEVEALVEYVKYLSMRGQMETTLINFVYDELGEDDDGSLIPLDPVEDAEQGDIIVNDLLAEIVEGWEEAEEYVIVPGDESLPPDNRSTEEIALSAAKGRALFYGTRANCVKCHGPTGLGDGQQDDYNIWNKSIVNFRQETEALGGTIETLRARRAELDGQQLETVDDDIRVKRQELADRQAVLDHMFSPRNAIPRNLRLGTFRGGRRPLDLFRRVYTGISGTPMPGGGPASPGAKGTLSDDEIWQLVDYVRSLPFEPASQPRRLLVNYDTLN